MANSEQPPMIAWAIRQPAVWATAVFTVAALAALTASASDNPAGRVAVGLILGGGVIVLVSLADWESAGGALLLLEPGRLRRRS